MKKSRIRTFLSIVVSAGILMSSSASANGLLPATANQITPAVMPSIPETISATGIDSMQSIEAKISDIFKPEKKKAKLSETYSGTCGDNVNWNLDTITGVLTISGTGAMESYSASTNVPWYSYSTSIKTLVIEDGVTSINDMAFLHCSGLTSITVGSNNSKYQSVDGVLFNKASTTLVAFPCGKTGSYNIPDSVTSIGSYAFYGCSGLTSITIPDTVTSIGNHSFQSCNNLTSLTIPNSVTSIGDFAFNYCTGLTEVTIPTSIKYMGSSAFRDCTGLTEVTIHNSIASHAFSNCSGLTSVTILNSVTSIGTYAFCACLGLTSVFIPNSVTLIGARAFASCDNLISITVDSNNSNYKDEDGVLFNKDGTILVKYPGGKPDNYSIPNKVTYIDDYAFQSCSKLTSVNIPSSVTSVGRLAFSFCSGLTSIAIPNSVTTIEYSIFSHCYGLTTVTIPNSVTYIGDSAFAYCGSLASVTIPDSVTFIGQDTFEDCISLTSVSIPRSVTHIGDSAFWDCKSLTSVTYNGTSDPGYSSTNVFYNTKVNSVNVPTDYLNDTFCGKPVSRPTTAAFTALGDYFASRPKQAVLCGIFQFLV